MALYPKLSKTPALFFSTTGIRLARFEALLPEFERVYAEQEAQRKAAVVKTGAQRQRSAGGGAQFSTDLPERLLMLLLYYRLYLSQQFMTLLFEVEHKSTICRAIQQMRPVFEAILPVPAKASRTALSLAQKETERRRGRINNIADFVSDYPELSVLIDGTEQPKQRPKDKQKRKSDYSGKKKRHTLKQILITTVGGLILDQSPAVGGRCHDFQAFKSHLGRDEKPPKRAKKASKRASKRASGSASRSAPDERAPGSGATGSSAPGSGATGSSAPGSGATGSSATRLMEAFGRLRVVCTADSGFTGIGALGLPIETRLVERARRNHPLSAEQRVLNRIRSRQRIRVEHTIGQRKQYGIASHIYRNRDERYDETMNVVAGLVNLRVYDRIAERTGLDLMSVAV